ncbi:MAG: DUF1045 domain-containing protein, partial [Planktotalea sp.]|uniref:DUF1045 domain-containing protein n=1 Tax=Planktotalea sp. TaxID=2029877 RepID=UPI003C766C2E
MFERYAIYYTFDGLAGKLGACWLGWDIASGRGAEQPAVEGVDMTQATSRPRPYGFHATIKAPFYLAQGRSEAELKADFGALCKQSPEVQCGHLSLSRIGRFLALTVEDDRYVSALACQAVRALDVYRAPLCAEDLARRAKARLSEQQRAHLLQWGYPYVMDDFQFHVTLTGSLNDAKIEQVTAAGMLHFAPLLADPFNITH